MFFALAQIEALLDLIHTSLPVIAERLPAPEVQKLRDAVQDVEQALAQPVELSATAGQPGGDAPQPQLPPFVQDLVDLLKGDLERRAQHDHATTAIADRTARALEAIAESVKATAPASGA